MSKRVRLTDVIIDRVWSLYNKGYKPKIIAVKLGISQTSVLRCITAMATAATGKFVEYTGLLRDSHYIADYANRRFNLVPEPVDSLDLDLVAAITLLATNIANQTRLLESFIKKLER